MICFVFVTLPSTAIKWWITNIKTLTLEKKKLIDSLLGTMIKMIKTLSPMFKLLSVRLKLR